MKVIRTRVTPKLAALLQVIAGVVQQGVETGEFRKVDAFDVAVRVFGLVNVNLMRRALDPEPLDPGWKRPGSATSYFTASASNPETQSDETESVHALPPRLASRDCIRGLLIPRHHLPDGRRSQAYALQHSRDIAMSDYDIAKARAKVDEVLGNYYPTLGAGLTAAYLSNVPMFALPTGQPGQIRSSRSARTQTTMRS